MATLQRITGPLRRKLGQRLSKPGLPPDVTPTERSTIEAVGDYTMTSAERLISLIRAVEHLEKNNIGGPIVECGVWRGGSMMAVARTLLADDAPDRDLYLFDTFEGMSAPTESDRDIEGRSASDLLADSPKDSGGVWAYASLDDVTANLAATGYPVERLHLVQGPVEKTVPSEAPAEMALLRLDTDWYESTKHELEHLYPRLVSGGILIIDDYGHWEGARRAVDEYFDGELFLHRIDYTGRLAVKP
jgi:O-methyltransferase